MIDWARVDELRDEIGPDDFAEVIDLFLEEVDEAFARLQAGPDPEKLEDDLHFLKGGALNLGFQALAAQCQTGEKAAADGQAGTIDLGALCATYQSSRNAFLADPRTKAA